MSAQLLFDVVLQITLCLSFFNDPITVLNCALVSCEWCSGVTHALLYDLVINHYVELCVIVHFLRPVRLHVHIRSIMFRDFAWDTSGISNMNFGLSLPRSDWTAILENHSASGIIDLGSFPSLFPSVTSLNFDFCYFDSLFVFNEFLQCFPALKHIFLNCITISDSSWSLGDRAIASNRVLNSIKLCSVNTIKLFAEWLFFERTVLRLNLTFCRYMVMGDAERDRDIDAFNRAMTILDTSSLEELTIYAAFMPGMLHSFCVLNFICLFNFIQDLKPYPFGMLKTLYIDATLQTPPGMKWTDIFSDLLHLIADSMPCLECLVVNFCISDYDSSMRILERYVLKELAKIIGRRMTLHHLEVTLYLMWLSGRNNSVCWGSIGSLSISIMPVSQYNIIEMTQAEKDGIVYDLDPGYDGIYPGTWEDILRFQVERILGPRCRLYLKRSRCN